MTCCSLSLHYLRIHYFDIIKRCICMAYLLYLHCGKHVQWWETSWGVEIFTLLLGDLAHTHCIFYDSFIVLFILEHLLLCPAICRKVLSCFLESWTEEKDLVCKCYQRNKTQCGRFNYYLAKKKKKSLSSLLNSMAVVYFLSQECCVWPGDLLWQMYNG